MADQTSSISIPNCLRRRPKARRGRSRKRKKIVERVERRGLPETVLFETGYGPSGLPHIGTFGEVARTIDGAPRLPRADPRQDPDPAALLLRRHGRHAQDPRQRAGSRRPRAVSADAADRRCPIPFGGDYASFGDHNNAMLRRFLDTFGFDYEFASATEYYKSGRFDAVLLRAAERYDEIMAVMLPTLGEERQATYSPFLPISPKSRPRALRADEARRRQGRHHHLRRRRHRDHAAGHRRPREAAVEAGFRHALGRARRRFRNVRQGPPDQRGRSTTASARSSAARAPEHFVYELFLDENGQKISKSKGNGLTIDEWLTYAPTESLGALHVPEAAAGQEALFRRHPAGGRRVLPVPRRLSAAGRGRSGSSNPAWHIHDGNPPAIDMPVTVRAAAQPRQRLQRARTRMCCGASSRAMRRA